MVGTTLGKYRIEAEISQGGMGAVYRGVHVETGQIVAVKVLQPALAADRAFLQRFRREVRALQQIRHPNVIEVLDVGNEGDVHFYAMEFLASSLSDLIRGGPLAPRRAVAIARQVALGLEAAHAAGFCHRDIKPGNVLFTAEGVAKITDFGIAKVSEATRVTQTGAIVGTPTYMAPEQAEGPDIDARADIYSLGCVLYEMLVGKPPFDGHTALDVLRKHRFSLPEPPKSLNPHIPATLSHLTLQLLEKNPARRPPNMTFVASALEHIARNLAGEEPAPPEPRPRQSSSAQAAEQYERMAARIATWGKRLAIVAGALVLAYIAYRVGAYLRRGPADYFREAQAVEAGNRDDAAVEAYQALIERFPESPEAEQAQGRVNAIRERQRAARANVLDLGARDNTAIVRSEMAHRHFRRAEDEVQRGRVEHACEIYRMVRDQFPETLWAPRADARLQELEAKMHPKKPESEEKKNP